jgi:hypothetical protein
MPAPGRRAERPGQAKKLRFPSPKVEGNGGKLGAWFGLSLDDFEVDRELESRRGKDLW